MRERTVELCKRDEERGGGRARKRGEMKEKRGVFNVRGSCKVRRGLGRRGERLHERLPLFI